MNKSPVCLNELILCVRMRTCLCTCTFISIAPEGFRRFFCVFYVESLKAIPPHLPYDEHVNSFFASAVVVESVVAREIQFTCAFYYILVLCTELIFVFDFVAIMYFPEVN